MKKVLVHILASLLALALFTPIAFHLTGDSPRRHEVLSPDSVLQFGDKKQSVEQIALEFAPQFVLSDSLATLQANHFEVSQAEGQLFITYFFFFDRSYLETESLQWLHNLWARVYLGGFARDSKWVELVIDPAKGEVLKAGSSSGAYEAWQAGTMVAAVNGRNQLRKHRSMTDRERLAPPPSPLDDERYAELKMVRRGHATFGTTERGGNYGLMIVVGLFIVYYLNFMIAPYLWPDRAGTRAFRINRYFRREPEPFEAEDSGLK